ncbi:DUF2721 domain-containing protein [soil metagenome]|nr:DUF2721 domain-containing protein [Acidobacteriota bacterium]
MSPELAVLTSMITPAVLISACGALILSTSVRLGRVVDRVRVLSDRFEELAHRPEGEVVLYAERMELTFAQLDWLTSRARHLQRAMTMFYLSLGLFVATSVAIGFVGLTGEAGVTFHWIPVVFGMVGAGLLFVGTLLLGFEAALALRAIHAEMDFLWKLGRHHAPAPLVELLASRRAWLPPSARFRRK